MRDELLGRPVADRDWVVVGATPEIDDRVRLQAGRPRLPGVPASARRARSTRSRAPSASTDAAIAASSSSPRPTSRSSEDLARRDLTINAMARDEQGELIDPLRRRRPISRAGVLRHVSPAFAEDPLRVLRVARFAARFGFAVAPETDALMRTIVALGRARDARAGARLAGARARADGAAPVADARRAARSAARSPRCLPEVDALYRRAQPPARTQPGRRAVVHRARSTTPPTADSRFRCATRCSRTISARRRRAPPAGRANGTRVAERAARRAALRAAARAGRTAATSRASPRAGTAIVPRAPKLRPATLLDLLGAADALRRPRTPRGTARGVRVRRDVAARAPRRFRRPRRICARRSRSCTASMPARSRARRSAKSGAIGARASAAIAQAIRAKRLAALRAWQRRRRLDVRRRARSRRQCRRVQRALSPTRQYRRSRRGTRPPHHVGGDAHQALTGKGRSAAPPARRHRAVARLVVAHLLDDRAAFRVRCRQALDVRRQVLLDLALGFDDEPEVGAIAGDARGDADGERARVPQRVQQRRAIAELGEPLLRPREVLLLLARRRRRTRA